MNTWKENIGIKGKNRAYLKGVGIAVHIDRSFKGYFIHLFYAGLDQTFKGYLTPLNYTTNFILCTWGVGWQMVIVPVFCLCCLLRDSS